MPQDLEAAPVAAAMVRWQQAQQHLVNGRPDQALAIYQALLKHYPDTARLWYELAFAAGKQLDFALADAAGQLAAALAAKNVSLLVLLGQQSQWLRRLDRARACYEQAVAAAPFSIHAQLSLAIWYEREHRLDDAWRCVEACLACEPQNAQVLCVQALLLQRQNRSGEAETRLRDLIRRGSADASANYSCRQQLAVVLDQAGQHAEAMRWLGEAKALIKRSANVAKMEQDYDRAVRRRRELLAQLTPANLRRWREEGAATPAPHRLAFLGGHPRTGTTLLEQVLGAHPGISSFDEPTAFADEVADKLVPLNGPGLTANALNAMPAAQRTRFQQRYFKNLLRAGVGDPAPDLWLDKNPSPTSWLYLWLRLFPELKVIIALRDPRDVLISCYFQNLSLNPVNANFLSLDRTARHYCDLMDVWLRLRELGGFNWIETRYEDLVTGLETEGRRVTGFLGLAWHARQAAFHETNRKKFVFSPTYNEVSQPVYQRALGRWKHYAEALAPVQERLAPYCREFKYD